MSARISNTPGEEELGEALLRLREENPTLGIAKIHGLLVKTYPEWVVSEKRTKKVLQSRNLVLNTTSQPTTNHIYPSSTLIPHLDATTYSSKISVKYFNTQKGKGLVAKERIEEGEQLWKEDPWVVAPEWEIYELQKEGFACGYCTTMFSSQTKAGLVVGCSASEGGCKVRFCNRLCASRAASTSHPFLCPAQNPGSIPLLRFAKEAEWMALHALAQVTSRFLGLLCLGDKDKSKRRKDLKDSYEILSSLATLSLADRARLHFTQEPNHTQWKQVYGLYLRAFRDPEGESEKRKFTRLLGKRAKSGAGIWEGFEEIEKELFGYDAFLRNLGRMSLNLESHGGLYPLHSHLNHSCTPNISVRHLDTRTALARITLVARRTIEVGEELEISYVDPQMGVKQRKEEVWKWGFGCECRRCLEEEKEVRKGEVNGEARQGDQAKEEDLQDLEKELKAGLGLF